MVLDAIVAHPAFEDCEMSVYAKGSYPNNTNVRADSDVDVAVECQEVMYWDEAEAGAGEPGTPYEGIWTPERLRREVVAALRATFGQEVDTSGSTAIAVHSSTARVDADVVPCFSYTYYYPDGSSVAGTKVFRTSGPPAVNFPKQQLENGRAKNQRTNYAFKKTVRILKRVALAMAEENESRALPSYFIECLVYNCSDHIFGRTRWTDIVKGCLFEMWDDLEGEEPALEEERWMEVNEVFFLFHGSQEWTRKHGRDFSFDAWNYLDLGE